jgi:DNA-binding transcriptional MerR regulator
VSEITMEQEMRIGELSRRTGASPRSLRYYENQGLLTSSRSASGQRWYAESAVERVHLVRRLLLAGLSSTTIAEVLPCVQKPSEQASDAAWTRLLEERARIDATMADLTVTRDSLDQVIAANRIHRQSLAALS